MGDFRLELIDWKREKRKRNFRLVCLGRVVKRVSINVRIEIVMLCKENILKIILAVYNQ